MKENGLSKSRSIKMGSLSQTSFLLFYCSFGDEWCEQWKEQMEGEKKVKWAEKTGKNPHVSECFFSEQCESLWSA